MQKPSHNYDNVMVILHWVIGIGILLLGGLELFRQEFDKGHIIREALKPIHQPIGTALFALICVRVAWRLMAARIPVESHSWSLSSIATKLVHFALYLLMIGLPILGLIYVFGNDKAIDFGVFKLVMPLKSVLGDYAKSARSLHETLGVGILALALLHAAAALFHHYVLKDGLISKMQLQAYARKSVTSQPAE